MKLYVIHSESKGNATIVEHDGRVLLIDMGISLTSLKATLAKLNKNLYNIDAMLLTHEHTDHTKGICYLPPLPIYTLEGTYESENVNYVLPYKQFQIGPFKITPVNTSHDVNNPTGFVIKTECEKLVYITDTGMIGKRTLNKCKNADYYVFESNHDVDMLWKTNRPYFLKRRILSNKGHLSNEQSANYLVNLIGENTKEIILAHLSEEANCPEVALKTHKKIYKENNINLKKIKLHCANQNLMVEGGDK